jgi:hypothetical protein
MEILMDSTLYFYLMVGGAVLALPLLTLARYLWRVASQGSLWSDRFEMAAWLEYAGCAALAVTIYGLVGWGASQSVPALPIPFWPNSMSILAFVEMVVVALAGGDALQRATENKWHFEQEQRDQRARAAYEQRLAGIPLRRPPLPPRSPRRPRLGR